MIDPGHPCEMMTGRAFAVTRADVNEVNVHAVDGCDELRQCFELGLGPSPAVARAPISDERLELGELYALRRVVDRLAVGPARSGDAPAQIGKVLLWDMDRKGADCVAFGSANVRRLCALRSRHLHG